VTVFRPLEIYTFLVLEYLVLILVISALVRRHERSLGSDESRGHER
jgi:polar amino acid transport system permease protein